MKSRSRWIASMAAAATTAVGGLARADLKIKWDCYLPGASVECALLESSLSSRIPFVKVVDDPARADVAVSVTSVPAEDGTRFNFVFRGKQVDGAGSEARTSDRIPSSIDAAATMVRLMTKIERGLAVFMGQRADADFKNGALRLWLVDPASEPFTGRPEQDDLKWYFAPSIGSYVSDVQGVGINASGTGSVAFNYSEARWRLQQAMSFSYSRQSQPVPGTDETASIDFTGASATNVLAWTLGGGGRWSLGLLVSAEKSPQANYRFRANGLAGVELDLVPRQTVSEKNLGFRCAVGPEMQRYDAANTEGLDGQLVGRQFCDSFVSWHFAPVDLWASLGETSIVEQLAYRSLSVGLAATWRVTDDLLFAPWLDMQEINRAINEARPTSIVYSDPRQEIEASMRSAIERGYTAPFGIQSGLSIRYLFGNGSLASEDQRWKGVPSLR